MSRKQPMPTDSDFLNTFDPSISPIISINSDVLEISLPTNVNPPLQVLNPCSINTSPNAHLPSMEFQPSSTNTTSSSTKTTSKSTSKILESTQVLENARKDTPPDL